MKFQIWSERIIGVPEGKERKKRAESSFKEIIAENVPNLGKELDIWVREANRTPYYLNAKDHSKTHYNETVKNKW